MPLRRLPVSICPRGPGLFGHSDLWTELICGAVDRLEFGLKVAFI